MADIQSNIQVNIDTSSALSSIRLLQKQISAFHTTMAKGGASANAVASNLQQNLINSINATGKFSAEMRTVKTTTESFTNALEKNKLSMREYFRYSGASTKTFGRLFRSEFETINKVSRERVKDLQTQYIKMGRDANGALKAIAVRPLALDMDNLATRTAMAAQKQALLNQMLKQGSTNLLNYGKNTQWAGRQLMVGFTIPLTMLGTTAAKTFMQMEEQAIRFKRVYGDTFTATEETDKMLSQIKELGKEFTKYGVSVEETMRMAADAAAMGKQGADLLAQVNQATRLAVLGGVEQEQALETTISLTNAFGTAADDLAGKINFLNSVENQTVTSIEDLTIAIPKAGPVVQQLGGDVEDLAFFLTAMKEGGINASEGANALKSGLASLINPTGKAADMLQGFGVNVREIVNSNKGDVKGIVIDFAEALDTLDPLNRAQAIEQMFGKFQFARLSTLFQNVIKEGSQASRVLEMTNATTEELAILAERELKRVEESPMYKFKAAIEELKISLVPLGEAFLKAVTPIVEFATKVLEKFNGLSDGAKSFLVGLTGVAGIIAPAFLMTFGLIANGVANLIKLFVSIKGVYNKVSGSTTNLGQTTDYMTQQQMEAAAVASSLEQAHMRLAQVFSSERGALEALTTAYTKAIAVQAQYTGAPIPGRGKPVKKFNKGVLMVPGTGNKDTVPAMLTPGEAVVPKDMVQKYGALLGGMIAGNLPGYNKGFMPGGMGKGYKNATIYLPESMNTAMGGSGQGASMASVTEYLKRAGSAAMAPLMTVMAREMGMKINDPRFIAEFQKLGSALSTNAITALERSGKSFVTDNDFEELVVPAMRRTTQEVQVAGKSMAQAFDNAVTQIRTVAPVGSQSGTRSSQGRTGFSGSYKSDAVRKQAQQFAMATNPQEFQKIARFSTTRGKTINEFRTRNIQTDQWEISTAAHITKSVTDSVNNLIAKMKPILGDIGARVVKATSKGVSDGAAKEARVASPSKETQRVGKEIGRGAVLGVQESVDDARVAGQKVGTAVVAGVTEKASQSRNMLYGSGPVDSGAKSMRRQLQKQAKLQQLEEKRSYRESIVVANMGNAAEDMKDAAKKLTLRDRVSGAMGKMGVGGVGMAASGVLMGASMLPGQIGQTAQQLMMPVMALTMLLPLLSNPITLAVVALGALAGGAWYLNERLKQATEAGMKLGQSMSMTNDKLLKMSEITGQVSATEIRKKQQENQLTGESGKTRKFGQTYLESESGKQMLGDIATMSESGMTEAQVASTISRNLSVAIMQGVVTPEQARSIAAGLGQELGNYSISAQISGDLVSLFGKDGTNLLENPLKVAVELQATGQKAQQDVFNAAQAGQQSGLGGAGIAGAGVAAGSAVALGAIAAPAIATAGGLGLGAAGMVTAGAANIWNPVGWALLATGIVAAGVAVFDYNTRQAENNKLNAAAIQLGFEQVAVNQGILDSTTQAFDQKIRDAEANLKAAKTAEERAKAEKELSDLLDDRSDAITQLNSNNSEYLNNLASQKDTVGAGTFQDSVNASLEAKKETASEPMKVFIDKAKKDLEGLAESDFKTTLQVGIASDQLDPITVSNLITAGANNENLQANMDLLIKERGMADFNQVTQLLLKAGLQGDKMDVLFDFMATDEGDFETNMEALSQLANMQQEYGFKINLEGDLGKEKVKELSEFITATEDLPEVINTKVLSEFLDKNPDSPASAQIRSMIDNWDVLSGGKENISKSITIDFVAAGDQGVLDAYLAATGKSGLKNYLSPQVLKSSYEGAANAWAVGGQGKNNEDDKKNNKNNQETSGAKDDPYENVLTSLKRVRDASINAAGGAKELKRILGGNKDIKIFSGMEQSLIGMNDQFTEYLMGLDDGVRKTFVTFKSGKAILTDLGKAMRKAYDEKVLGDFQLKQLQTTASIRNQNAAFARLTKAGFDAESAYDAVADSAFAAAVANKKLSDAELKKIAKAWAEAKKKKDDYDRIRSIRSENTDYAKQVQVLQKLESVAGQYSQEQISSILGNATLMDQFLANPNNTDFVTNIQNILDKKQFDLRVKMLTIEGQEEIFQDGFSKAMEAFAAEEQRIEIDFQIKNKADLDAIAKAENDIADLQYKIDDWEAGLKDIEKQEKKINDEYEAKFSALDKVQRANDAISRQQKSQLTLADALSQGDIAAAARAAQEMRSQSATDSISDQRVSLEQAKENELASVRNALGYTREQIETSIADLQEKIFDIEEKSLEPARDRIRLAELAKQEQIKNLEVLEKTKFEWEQIKNNIDVAKTRSTDYKTAIQAALDVVAGIVKHWNDLNGKVVSTTHVITTVHKTVTQGTPATDQYGIMEKSGLAQANSDYFEKQVLPAIEDGTANASQVIDYANAVNEALGRPQGTPVAMAKGGVVPGMKYFLNGGFAKGTDTVPAMLTPGEFVVSKFAVKDFGVDRLKSINSGTYDGGSVYNYSVSVNVKSDANPDEIANSVMTQIKQIESRRLRGVRL